MSKIIVNGSKPLSGTVRVHGAKNAVLPILAATVMAEGVHTIHNCPELSDVETTVEILQELGADIKRCGDVIYVDVGKEMNSYIPERLMRKLRSSIVFMGAVLARNKQAKMSGRKICKGAIFALVGRLPAAKMPAALTHMSPEPITRQRGCSPPTPPRQISRVG